MKRIANWAAIAALVSAALVLGLRPSATAATPAQEVDSIAASLRCPVCQGLSVKDSQSQTARDIRADIGRRLTDGQTAADIRQAYVDRYGKWVLLRPATSGFESLVWALPAAGVGAGAIFLGVGFFRWRRRSRGRAPTDDDLVLVAMALSDRSDGSVPATP